MNIDIKGNKKVKNAWAFYDWANSVYPLVITTAIFPLFYESYAAHETVIIDGTENKIVYFFGWEVINTVLISIITASYFLLLCIFLPLLSGIADYAGKKKTFLRFFCYLGSIACMGLYFFDIHYLELSMLVFAIAGIGFWSSLVFYNAYLPEIAPIDQHDSLSAKGFSFGYIGSVILLVVCLIFVMSQNDDAKVEATRWCFVFTGIWWFGFSHITYYWLPSSEIKKKVDSSVIWNGYKELKIVYKKVKNTVRLKRYLASFFVYSMAVQTIMIMAIYFGTKEINWANSDDKSTGLIIAILMIQLLAIIGALILSKVSYKIGNLNSLKIVLFLWISLCIYAYWVESPFEFYIISGMVGLVMGGVQSLSRSTYSKYIPQDTLDTASYFSFYDVAEKIGIVIGMSTYGFIEQLTGNMRNSIVALVLFFVIGLILLLRVPKEESILT